MSQVLVVCTGNICRSPYMEYALRAMFSRLHIPVEVSGAGVHAMVGHGAPPQIQQAIVTQGLDASDFASRQIVEDMIEQAEIIIVAAREHRRAVVQMVPLASRKTFTLLEIARLLPAIADNLSGSSPAERWANLPTAVATSRGMVPLEKPEDDDVIDPWMREDSVYDYSVQQMQDAIRIIESHLNR